MRSPLHRKLPGIQLSELLVVAGMYVVFSFIYHTTLWLNRAGYKREDDSLWDFWTWWDAGGLQYLIMFLMTAVIWWINFRLFGHWKLWQRFLFHLLTLPPFLLGAQQGYYLICDWFGMGHLSGPATVWDLYIPALFYLFQFGVFHAYEYFRENQRKLVVEGELKSAALRSELSAIKAQLNPHFLYNVFNTINASVPPQLEDTREMIAELSDLFRYQLRAARQDLVPLRDELQFVQQYLALEKRRFEERLQISVNVPEELLDEPVPPMLLQPLVENSLKHGLSSLIEGGEVRIDIFRRDRQLCFRIADTGVGAAGKEQLFGQGIGLTNTRLRLQKMYATQLELLDNSPRGFIVQFSIPA